MFEALRSRFTPRPAPAQEPRPTASDRLRTVTTPPDTRPSSTDTGLIQKFKERQEAERNIEASVRRCLILFSNNLHTIKGIHEYLPLLDKTLVGQKATPEIAARVCTQIAEALNDFYMINAGGQTRTGRTGITIPESRTGFTLIPQSIAETRLVDTAGRISGNMTQWSAEWSERQSKAQ